MYRALILGVESNFEGPCQGLPVVVRNPGDHPVLIQWLKRSHHPVKPGVLFIFEPNQTAAVVLHDERHRDVVRPIKAVL